MTLDKVVPGQIIRHFKRDLCNDDYRNKNWYLYKIIAIGKDANTRVDVVIYQALYDDFQVYVRPLEELFDEVDTTIYPRATQKHRFEVAMR